MRTTAGVRIPSKVGFVEGSRPWGSCWAGNNFIISYPELTDKDASNRLSVSCRSLQTQAIAGIKKEVL